ncbi:hypothetical protein CEXT_233451 [Caerostris extrusa]|uniref:Uncharacterized protein n=1 Tax=Caerostris extrusa TaxID=172846 RepID=A0AAV4RRA1_CAEEX|nr:hypothetical protein CEXT_233451 [Caerostris extrusa]
MAPGRQHTIFQRSIHLLEMKLESHQEHIKHTEIMFLWFVKTYDILKDAKYEVDFTTVNCDINLREITHCTSGQGRRNAFEYLQTS